ncbi:MAG TPA: adenosine deaminase [Acidimicrobiales bacterium]|nr:adenosine deaminase [Acidimicrobiales bacterium]
MRDHSMPDDGFLRGMPKVELHVHLEGSIRPPLLLGLAERNGIDLGARSVEEVTARYAFRDFAHFIELYLVGMSAIRSGQDVLDAIDALAADLAQQNVRYAEVTTTAYLHFANGTPVRDYRDALDLGARRAAADHGVEVGWIVDIPRSIESPEEGWTAEFLTGPLAPSDAVAIGLGGPEAEFPPEWYRTAFDRARAAGVPGVVHAGEVAGPASVRGALDALQAVRIGHGVRSMEDRRLVRELAERQVPLEVCVTSNVLLGVYPSLAAHPLPAMLEAGLNVSINTDDPGYFSTTLNDEHIVAHERLGVPVEDLVSAQRRAVDASLCSPERKAALHAALAAFVG